ncbi:MAG TPA: S-formylglutathione hydrolase [Thermoanaerobaculia bacterium]|nr:S-formylglutathione hydrolase [Thermoanaerobaculia bacterium]
MADSPLRRLARSRSFDGWLERYQHDSEACACVMTFGVYLPPQAERGPVPALYWLSGLTCTDENFMSKAGAHRRAAELGLALVVPDTSPRGVSLPGEDEDWDFGSGAGFYVDATEEPWSRHYRMDTYVTRELPALIEHWLPIQPGARSVSGHSMGGHGALTAALRNPGRYRSVSAFAPIAAPTRCPWGRKAFAGYLGAERDAWRRYDACELLREAESAPRLLVDQGDADPFLEEQLGIEHLREVCAERGHQLDLRVRAGYDHSYYTIATFIDEHLDFHARALAGAA